MHNVLKIAELFKTVAVRLRLIFQFTYVQYCRGENSVESVNPNISKVDSLKDIPLICLFTYSTGFT